MLTICSVTSPFGDLLKGRQYEAILFEDTLSFDITKKRDIEQISAIFVFLICIAHPEVSCSILWVVGGLAYSRLSDVHL